MKEAKEICFFLTNQDFIYKKIKIFLNPQKIVKQVENFSGIQSMNGFTLNFPPQHTIPYKSRVWVEELLNEFIT